MPTADLENGSSVVIERFHCRYVVPREHPAPEALSGDLNRLVRTSVADACARSLAYALDPRDPAVWVIRRLDFTLSLDAGYAEASRIGEVWGSHFALAIARTIQRGPDGDTVLRFPDRASYLAAFLRDLVRGRAFDLWQYRGFASLRSLPQAAVAREALTCEATLIPSVLAALDPRSFEGLLDVLGSQEVLRVIESAIGVAVSTSESDRQCAALLLEHWRGAAARPIGDSWVTPHNLLRLLVHAVGKDRPWTGLLAAVAGHLLSFTHIVHRFADPRKFLSALSAGDLRAAAAEAIGRGDSRYLESLPFLRDLGAGDLAFLTAAAETVAGHAVCRREGETETRYNTPFGGILLLAPIIAGPEIGAMLDASGIDPGRGALALLMKCVGGKRAPAVFADPVFRRLTGIPPQLSAREFSEGLPALPIPPLDDDSYFVLADAAADVDRSWSAAAATVLRRFASRFAGFDRSRPERLYENFLDVPASVTFSAGGVEARIARPPLAILLQMCGMDSVTTRPGWLGGLEVTISLDEA